MQTKAPSATQSATWPNHTHHMWKYIFICVCICCVHIYACLSMILTYSSMGCALRPTVVWREQCCWRVCYWLNNWVWISQCGVLLAGLCIALHCDNPINLGHYSDQKQHQQQQRWHACVDKMSPNVNTEILCWFSLCCNIYVFFEVRINCPRWVFEILCITMWRSDFKYSLLHFTRRYAQRKVPKSQNPPQIINNI